MHHFQGNQVLWAPPAQKPAEYLICKFPARIPDPSISCFLCGPVWTGRAHDNKQPRNLESWTDAIRGLGRPTEVVAFSFARVVGSFDFGPAAVSVSAAYRPVS